MSVIWEMTTNQDATPVAAPLLSLLKSKPKDSREMQEKLTNIRPRTIGQASRIPGVTPAAVSLVNVYIEIQARRRDQAAAL